MPAPRIDPGTSIGAVRLAVAELDRAHDFYERAIGLRTVDREARAVRLGADDTTLVELVERPDARPRPRGTTGLFHLAILVPRRAELARALRRVAETGSPLAGASDHLVSEAIYLADPEGNGIEIYRDRPREQWPREDGELQMGTYALDLDSLLAESPAEGPSEAAGAIPPEATAPEATAPEATAPGTRIGHVHLQVGDLETAEEFYSGVLGFEVTVRGYPGALFMSAGGYHHHIGVNTWAGEGAPPPSPDSRGLRRFEVVVPTRDALEEVESRLAAAEIEIDHVDEGLRVTDPWGAGVLLRAARGQPD